MTTLQALIFGAIATILWIWWFLSVCTFAP